jgi:hypothetical protein
VPPRFNGGVGAPLSAQAGPIVNRDAEIVGLVFDGNLDSLVWDYVFDDTTGRTLGVHSSAMIEALRKVYDAPELADELVNGQK